MKRNHSQRVAYWKGRNRLADRIAAWEITLANQRRGKYYDGFHKPGSTNKHKQG